MRTWLRITSFVLGMCAVVALPGPAAARVLHAVGWSSSLSVIDPATGLTMDSVDISVPVDGHEWDTLDVWGLAAHPVTGDMWALLHIYGVSARELAIVDPMTGFTTLIGDTGDLFNGLAFDATGSTLYAVTGGDASTPNALFRLSTTDGTPTFLMNLNDYSYMESIGFTNGLLYHASGQSLDSIFESIDPITLATSSISLSDTFGYEPVALAPKDRTTFLMTDGASLFDLTTGGVLTLGPALDQPYNAIAFAPTRRLYSIGYYDNLLRVLDTKQPFWTTSSVPVTLPGKTVLYGQALTAHPATGALWAVLLLHDASTFPNELVTLDPQTGVATDIGMLTDGEDYFTGLAFDSSGVLYGVTTDPGGNTALYRVNTSNGSRTLLTTLTPANLTELLAFNPRDGLLYVEPDMDLLQSIDPATLTVTDIPIGNWCGGSEALTYLDGDLFMTFGGEVGVLLTNGWCDSASYASTDHDSAGLAVVTVYECGNGVVEPGEQCDDGNTQDGDCCSSTCQFETIGSSCNDRNLCTSVDICDGAGSCMGLVPVTCTALDQCHVAGVCDPVNGCSNPPKTNGTGCDDGNECTIKDQCINGTCTGNSQTCGDGVVQSSCGEQCDDGNTRSADGCSATCKLENRGRSCQQAIAKAGSKLFKDRLSAIQTCRNKLNKGVALFFDAANTQPLTDPADCANEYNAKKKILKAGTQARTIIATPGKPKCTDALVHSLAACAATVDGLINASGGTGCLVTTHAGSVDAAIGQEYGHLLSASDKALNTCQTAIASAGRSYAGTYLSAVQSCRNGLNRNKAQFFDDLRTKPLTDPADCASSFAASKKILKAGQSARKTLAKAGKEKCTDTLLSGLGACAATVDGLTSPDGTGGCLITGHAAQADSAIEAEY